MCHKEEKKEKLKEKVKYPFVATTMRKIDLAIKI